MIVITNYLQEDVQYMKTILLKVFVNTKMERIMEDGPSIILTEVPKQPVNLIRLGKE